MNQKRFTVFLCLKVNTAYRKSVHKYKKVLDKTLPGARRPVLPEKLTMSSRPKIPKYARDKKSGHQRQLSGDLLRLQRLCFLCSHQYRPAVQHRAAGRPGATQYLHPRIIRQCQTRRSGVFRRHL